MYYLVVINDLMKNYEYYLIKTILYLEPICYFKLLIIR